VVGCDEWQGEMLGVGVITCDRDAAARECIGRLTELTHTEFVLCVADDGSRDGTALRLRADGVWVVGGQRRGCAWNKNRALFALSAVARCDPILLLEDDCWPGEPRWERNWVKACETWGHVNAIPFGRETCLGGTGTPADPYRCDAWGGVCTITSRGAVAAVGFLDTRFVGYGYEHVEWTTRFARYFRGRWPDRGVPCLWSGLEMQDLGSHHNAGQLARNQALWPVLCHDPVYRNPWRGEAQRRLLLSEVIGNLPLSRTT